MGGCRQYYRQTEGFVLSSADTIIRLRLPFRVTFWHLFRRTARRASGREVRWGTNKESWLSRALRQDSILLYSITSQKSHVRKTLALLEMTRRTPNVIVLRSAGQVRDLLAWAPSRTASS